MSKSFTTDLNKTIVENLFNNYTDNHDIYRFGPAPIEREGSTVKTMIRKSLNKKGYFSVASPIDYAKKCLDVFEPKVGYFEYLYNILEDNYSKDLLVKVCAFRILGKRKIKLPMNNPEFWTKVLEIENTLKQKNDFIQTGFKDWKEYKYNLNSLGYPISLYFNACSIYYDFVYKSYSFNNSGTSIQAEKGDYVIDAGGCYGDTALFFAHSAGNKGRVYTFEFVPSNVEILSKNLDLNPALKERVTLFKSPLWSKSGIPIYFESNGPGTKVSMNKISDISSMTPTVTIDDLVSEEKIERVDFIKMDIEGAETEALNGARETIIKFKPKLAISLYHSEKDFKSIPEFIHGLNLGYKFYFNHYTMHAEESVLFCIVP
jgi:FkbM family methyltransferase